MIERSRLKSTWYTSIERILILLSVCFYVLCLLHFQKNQDTDLEYLYVKIKKVSLATFPRSKAYKYSEAMHFWVWGNEMPEGQGQSPQRSVGLNYFSGLWTIFYSDNRKRHRKNPELNSTESRKLTEGLQQN